MHPIVIIGSGLAGYNLAREIRKHDKDVPLTIITANAGQYYSKPLLSTALTQKKSAAQIAMMDAEKMQTQLNAKVLTQTEVKSISPQTKTLTLNPAEEINYEKLVIAWGAEVIDPQLKGDGLEFVHAINELDHYETFRQALSNKKRVAILGSGLIGCEFANDLINTDVAVDVISLSSRPIDTLLEETTSEALAHALEKKGVNWHWQTSVEEVNQSEDGIAIKLSSGKTLSADLMISAIGIRPRISIAKAAGLKTNKGIVVDEYLQTSDASIFALGDCAEICGHVCQYILPISHEVKALAQTLTGQKTAAQFPAMPISIKTPACPVVALPPASTAGDWKVEAAGDHIRAIFEDANSKNVLGFVLTGDRVKERLELTTLAPPLLASEA